MDEHANGASGKHYPKASEIRAAQDLPWEDVPVPELGPGCCLRIRTMKASELLAMLADGVPPPNRWAALVLIHCTLDPETGGPLFDDEAIEWLNEKSCAWVNRAFTVAARLNGLEVDKTAKN